MLIHLDSSDLFLHYSRVSLNKSEEAFLAVCTPAPQPDRRQQSTSCRVSRNQITARLLGLRIHVSIEILALIRHLLYAPQRIKAADIVDDSWGCGEGTSWAVNVLERLITSLLSPSRGYALFLYRSSKQGGISYCGHVRCPCWLYKRNAIWEVISVQSSQAIPQFMRGSYWAVKSIVGLSRSLKSTFSYAIEFAERRVHCRGGSRIERGGGSTKHKFVCSKKFTPKK